MQSILPEPPTSPELMPTVELNGPRYTHGVCTALFRLRAAITFLPSSQYNPDGRNPLSSIRPSRKKSDLRYCFSPFMGASGFWLRKASTNFCVSRKPGLPSASGGIDFSQDWDDAARLINIQAIINMMEIFFIESGLILYDFL